MGEKSKEFIVLPMGKAEPENYLMAEDFNPEGKRYRIQEFDMAGEAMVGIIDCLKMIGISFPKNTEDAVRLAEVELFPNGAEEMTDEILEGLLRLGCREYPKQFTTLIRAMEAQMGKDTIQQLLKP